MRILFLDDNPQRHKTFRQRSIGCSVDFAFNAQEALEFIKRHEEEYDILFLDHDLSIEHEGQMTEGAEDGRFFCREIINLKVHARKPSLIIFLHSLNGDGRDEMEDILLDAGFTNVYNLPFSWQMFTKSDDGNIVMDSKKRNFSFEEMNRVQKEEDHDTGT